MPETKVSVSNTNPIPIIRNNSVSIVISGGKFFRMLGIEP